MSHRLLVALTCVPLIASPSLSWPQPPAARAIKTSKGSFTVPGKAFADGRDLEAQPPPHVMSINVWDAASRQRAVCQLPHAAPVELLDAQLYKAEERYYFRVRAGKCEGWLPNVFLPQKPYAGCTTIALSKP